jgi:CheY-like chemotaxis protein
LLLAPELHHLLAVIGGPADAIELALPAEGPARAAITAIRRAVRSGAGLAGQVRRLSGRTPAPQHGVDVQPMVEAAARDAMRRFGHRLSVVVHAAPDLWSAAVPPTLIAQALGHLVSRAADAMPHGATLNVRSMNVEPGGRHAEARRERQVRVELSAPTVVAGGQLAGDEDAPADGGPLLEMLRRVGAQLSVETDGATTATWVVQLPSDGVEPLRPAAPVDRGAAILLVDADDARRQLVQTLLHKHGYAARVADSVDEAARTLAGAHVDLVVADCALHGTSGDVATLAHRHAVPMLRLVAAGAGDADREAGPVEVLRMPFSGQQLLAGVEAALSPPRPVAGARVPVFRDAVAVCSEEFA